MLKMKIFTCLLGVFVLFIYDRSGNRSETLKLLKLVKHQKLIWGEPQKFQLENGLKVFLVEDHQLPQLAMEVHHSFTKILTWKQVMLDFQE